MARTLKGPVRFKVTGHYPFPIDMLRYDRCTPDCEVDSYKIISVSDAIARREGPVTITLRSHSESPGVPTIGRWRSFGWDVTSVWSDREAQFIKSYSDAKPERDTDYVQVLKAMRDEGLTFGSCVQAFGAVGDEVPFVKAASAKYGREGEVEIDDTAVVSKSEGIGGDAGGAYVMGWLYVRQDDAK
jgi:hypothetical protein